MCTRLKRPQCLMLAVVVVLIWYTTSGGQQPPPCNQPPLTLQDVEDLFKAGVPVPRIRQLAGSCGVTFILDAEGDRRLRTLGVPVSLVELFSAPVPAAGQRWTPPTDRREMVGIGPGTFRMGSPGSEPGRDDDERQHSVEIERAFWLDVNLVTNDGKIAISAKKIEPGSVMRVRI